MSRKIEDLTPATQVKYHAFKEVMEGVGIDFIVTCTLRTQAEQNALYAQGRTTPGKIVTWTHNSNHIKGTAFDIVIMKNGKPSWDTTMPEWKQAGALGVSVGLIWGGNWEKTDFPHFENKEA